MKKLSIIFSVYSWLLCMALHAQQPRHGTGLLPDDGVYNQLPKKAELLTRDYTAVPSSYSLKKFCPKVNDQADYGTCTSYASAYAARTIAEAIKWGWTDKEKITNEAFSPPFIYTQIKDRNDVNCQRGAQTYQAIQLMKTKGVCKYSSFHVMCANSVSNNLFQEAAQYKIDDYFILFNNNSQTTANDKIDKVKKAISEDCPVVISMYVPKSFHSSGAIWSGVRGTGEMGRHAMCVVGYDNNKSGGAFEIMNSWGTNWANAGFVWVKYSDFAKYVYQAYELYVKKQPKPTPTPQPQPAPVPMNRLSGEVELQLATGEKMRATFDNNSGMYKIAGAYISGTRYRIYIANNEPAYVYVISSDLTNQVNKVFPPRDDISAALTYQSNHVAIPDEKYYVEMDNTQGKDYLCVLYSTTALDINNIITSIKNGQGDFRSRLKHAIELIAAPPATVEYQSAKMSFSVKTPKTLVPIVIEMVHR